jgi:predicted RNA-binding Zn-ribbon protein involved in translation (DUF1610 family)
MMPTLSREQHIYSLALRSRCGAVADWSDVSIARINCPFNRWGTLAGEPSLDRFSGGAAEETPMPDTISPPQCSSCGATTEFQGRISLPRQAIFRCPSCGLVKWVSIAELGRQQQQQQNQRDEKPE